MVFPAKKRTIWAAPLWAAVSALLIAVGLVVIFRRK